jgi:hypothetical protein
VNESSRRVIRPTLAGYLDIWQPNLAASVWFGFIGFRQVRHRLASVIFDAARRSPTHEGGGGVSPGLINGAGSIRKFGSIMARGLTKARGSISAEGSINGEGATKSCQKLAEPPNAMRIEMGM